MGCAHVRKQPMGSQISNNISYLMPEVCRSIDQAILTLYDQDSPIVLTPIQMINQVGNIEIYAKLDMQQVGGSGAIRGTYNKVLRVYEKAQYLQKEVRVVSSNVGSSAVSLIHAIRHIRGRSKLTPKKTNSLPQLLLEDTPTDPGDHFKKELIDSPLTPNIKFDITVFLPDDYNVQEHIEEEEGVLVVQRGEDYLESEQEAIKYADEQGIDFVSPYNDIDVIGGMATVGYEIDKWFLKFIQDRMEIKKVKLDYVFVSTDTGVQVAGVAAYLKYMRKLTINVIGVQHEQQCHLFNGVQEMKEGNSSPIVGYDSSSVCLPLCCNLVDDWVIVSETEVLQSLYYLVSMQGIIVNRLSAQAYAGSLKFLDKLNKNNNIYLSDASSELKRTMAIKCLVVLDSKNISIASLQEIMVQYQ